MAPVKKSDKEMEAMIDSLRDDFSKVPIIEKVMETVKASIVELRSDVGDIRNSVAGLEKKMGLLELIAQKVLSDDFGKQVEVVKKLEESSLMDLCRCYLGLVEEDLTKKQHEEEKLAPESHSTEVPSHVGGTLTSFSPEPIQPMIMPEKKFDLSIEIPLLGSDHVTEVKVCEKECLGNLLQEEQSGVAKWKDVERNEHARQVFDQMIVRGKKVRKKKRWKKLAHEISKPYRKSEGSRKIDGVMGKNVARRLHCLVLEYMAEKLNKKTCVLNKRHNLQKINRRLLLMATKRKKKRTRLKEHLAVMHFSVEGQLESKAVLFVPKGAPFDPFDTGKKPNNIKLNVRRVVILDSCEKIISEHLGFVKGIVYFKDLPLNILKETLQQNETLKIIYKNRGKKCSELFLEIAKNKEDSNRFYETFKNFKPGIHKDSQNRTKISELLRYYSTKSRNEISSLMDYVSRMKEGQNDIYYITGESKNHVDKSLLPEKLKKNSRQALYMVDANDEYAIGQFELEEKKLNSATKEGWKLGEVSAQKQIFKSVMDYLDDVIGKRAELGYSYGVLLIPEGLVNSTLEIQELIAELYKTLANMVVDESGIWKELTEQSLKLLDRLPKVMQEQLMLERDSHGNIQVAKLEIWTNIEIDWNKQNTKVNSTTRRKGNLETILGLQVENIRAPTLSLAKWISEMCGPAVLAAAQLKKTSTKIDRDPRQRVIKVLLKGDRDNGLRTHKNIRKLLYGEEVVTVRKCYIAACQTFQGHEDSIQALDVLLQLFYISADLEINLYVGFEKAGSSLERAAYRLKPSTEARITVLRCQLLKAVGMNVSTLSRMVENEVSQAETKVTLNSKGSTRLGKEEVSLNMKGLLDLGCTWERQSSMEQQFLQYDLGDKVSFNGGSIDTIWAKDPRPFTTTQKEKQAHRDL